MKGTRDSFGSVGKGWLLWFWAAVLLCPACALGQTRVLATYDGQQLPVVAMDGQVPIVEVAGTRYPAPDGRVSVVPAERFTDGAVEVLERDAEMGRDYGSAFGAFFFRFDARVRAERDFEDCYILFVIDPEQGEATYVIREVPDINVEGSERLLVTLPVNPGFGGGRFGYKLFSRGEEIRLIEPDEPIAITDLDEGEAEEPRASGRGRERSDAVSAGRPAEAVKPRLLQFPEELLGKVGGGYAEAIYSVDQQGRAFELLDIRADHAAFVPEVWKTVTQTRYRPGTFEGEPLVTTVQQRFFFNEFAPFSEEMIMIPYPTIKDRPPQAVYAPLPRARLSRPQRVALLATVGLTGRLSDVEVLRAEDAKLAQAALERVDEWVFLPAVEDGFAVEQRVEIPLEFRPGQADGG